MSKDYTNLLDNDQVEVKTVGTENDDKSLKVKTFVTAEEIARDSQIDPRDIENSLITLSAVYSRYAVLAARARYQQDTFETRLDLLDARLDDHFRKQAEAKGEKTTESKIRSSITSHAKYVVAKGQLNEASMVVKLLDTTLRAIEMKRDALVQINKNNTVELGMTTSTVGNVPLAQREERFNQGLSARNQTVTK